MSNSDMSAEQPPGPSVALLACVALTVAPFLSFGTGYHNNQRVLIAVCLTLAVPCVLLRLYRHKDFPRPERWPAIWIGAFFALGFMSSLLAYSPRHALQEWSTFLLLFLLTWVIASEAGKSSARGEAIVIAAGLGCALYVFKAVLVYVTILAVPMQPRADEFIFGFDNYRFFNHIQTLSLPLLVLLVANARTLDKWRSHVFWFVIAAVWWVLLFVSAGRGTFIGLLTGLLVACAAGRRRAFPWCGLHLKICFVGLVVYLLFFLFIPPLLGYEPFGYGHTVARRTMASPISGRSVLWPFAFKLAFEYPVLGVGPMHFAHFGQILRDGAHPHNWILQIAVEWGWAALACLLAVIAIACKEWRDASMAVANKDESNRTASYAWLMTAVAVLVDSLVSGLIVMPMSQLWLALTMGCAWGWTIRMKESRFHSTLHARSELFAAVITALSLFALLFLWLGMMPEIWNLSWFENHALDSGLYPKGMLQPRLWNGGYF